MKERPIINQDTEPYLCECDRPDQKANPQPHNIDVACVYWEAGRPSRQKRIDACRRLNIKDIIFVSEVAQ